MTESLSKVVNPFIPFLILYEGGELCRLLQQKEVESLNTIENLPDEKWREITGYDGQYLVSNMGRVKSLKGAKERILKAFPNNYGYPRVALCHRG